LRKTQNFRQFDFSLHILLSVSSLFDTYSRCPYFLKDAEKPLFSEALLDKALSGRIFQENGSINSIDHSGIGFIELNTGSGDNVLDNTINSSSPGIARTYASVLGIASSLVASPLIFWMVVMTL
jgi:hypothetical protein